MKYLINRHELPYDAMVADAAWLCPIEEDEEGSDSDADAEAEKVQTDEIYGEG